MVAAFQNNNLLDNIRDTLNLYLNFILGKGFPFLLLLLGEYYNNFFGTSVSVFIFEIPLYRFNNVKIGRITWLFKFKDSFLYLKLLGIKIFIIKGFIFYKEDTWFYLKIFLGK